MVKGKLIKRIKVVEDTGNIIEVKLWQEKPTFDKPHGYKYSLVYVVRGKRAIGYDNAEGKGDHRHYESRTETYRFTDLRTLVNDFYGDVEKFKKGNL
ncbi:MAG: DUF6516 family protein [Candidatus Brocadiaceae bacterium]